MHELHQMYLIGNLKKFGLMPTLFTFKLITIGLS
jgi:hypothetical protein